MTRREQILRTAAELFAERGFHGVSVSELGAACGISGPALYKHFPSKDAMLAEMLVRISEQLLDLGRVRVEEADTPAAAVEALIEWHTEFALTHRPLILVQDRDWESLPEKARDQVRSLQRAYVDLWAEQLRLSWEVSGQVLSLNASRAAAHALFGMLNSTPHSGLLPDEELRRLLSSMAMAASAAPR